MLQYEPGDLTPEAEAGLQVLTDRVMRRATRRERYTVASSGFAAKRPKAVFDEVRGKLRAVSPHVNACYYCERDRHRDIDHIRPKVFHPELAFDWRNYAYSCTICNQDAKRSKYAIIDAAGQFHDCAPLKGTNNDVPLGQPAFINPRAESGLDFFDLDLETGVLLVRGDLDGVGRIRAIFTRDTLDLNSDGLVRIRRQAFRGFVRFVEALSDALSAGNAGQAARLEEEVEELGHPTVMVEAWRQRGALGAFGQMLEALYDRIGLSRWCGADPPV